MLSLRVDNWGYAILEPSPSSLLFDRQAVEWTWTEQNSWGIEQAGDWASPQRVAQVVAWGYDPVTMRHYRIAYPERRAPFGSVTEIKDITVSSPDQLREIARALYRDGNTRRKLVVTAGACPWLQVNQRHVVSYPSLDAGGAWAGINFYVESFAVEIGLSRYRSLSWKTTITLREMAL